MIRKYVAFLDPVGAFLIASILVYLGIHVRYVEPLVAQLCGGYSAARVPVLRELLVVYGAGSAAWACWSLVSILRTGRCAVQVSLSWAHQIVRETTETWAWFFEACRIRNAGLWLVAVTAIGMMARSFYLTQPMRYDEAFTFVHFGSGRLANSFYYPLPNNHVLNTLFIRLSTAVFGSAPAAIRLPAFLAGVLVIPLTFCLVRLLTASEQSGYLAAVLVAVYPYLLLYDTMARGYSLLVLLTLCLTIVGYRLIHHPSASLSAVGAIVVAIGLLDMPSILFPTLGILLWVVGALYMRGRKPTWILRQIVLPGAAVTMCLTGVFYSPVVVRSDGIDSIIANRFVEGLPWHEFWTRLPAHVAATASAFTRGVPVLLLVLGAIGIVGGGYSLYRKRNWLFLSLYPWLAVGVLTLLSLKHAIPYPRTWIFLLPFAFILVDAGAMPLVGRRLQAGVHGLLLVAGALTAVFIMTSGSIPTYPDTGVFPRASTLAGILGKDMHPKDKLYVRCPADAPLLYYLQRRHVRFHRTPAATPSTTGSTFYVIKPSAYQLPGAARQRARLLYKAGDSELYEVPPSPRGK